MKQSQRLKAAQKRWYALGWVLPSYPWNSHRFSHQTNTRYRLLTARNLAGGTKVSERFTAVTHQASCQECDGYGGYHVQNQFDLAGHHEICPACKGQGFSKKRFHLIRG